MGRFYHKLALIALATTLALPAAAVPLAPGGVVATGGTTFAANPDLGGTVLNDNLIGFTYDPTPVTPFSNIGGNVQNRVVRSTNTGNLIFAPRIRDTYNIDGAAYAILGFQLLGFGTFATDVDFRTDGLGDSGFSSVSRSVDGNLMTFRYDDRLHVDSINPPGRQEESLFPSIETNAHHYDFSGSMRIFAHMLPLGATSRGDIDPNSVFTITIDGLAVPAAIPVPAAGGMLALALGLLGWSRRRTPA